MSALALSPVAAEASGLKAHETTASSSTTNTSNSNQTSLNALGSTFMQLLVQELQNQDPTAPMDSTQMVGQMISLNQLDQIASINQLLTTTLGTTTTTPSSGSSH